MNFEELEVQYREAIDDVLNQMQTMVLLLAQAETKAVTIGDKLQTISEMMEPFFAEQRQRSIDPPASIVNDMTALKASELELQKILSKLRA